ncbi:MAG: septal ring lytic transglycosylase RlpA family protein [Fusobacteriaceae bacterium]
MTLLTVVVSTNAIGKVGIASWYGKPFDGRITRYGERYDMNKLTAASNRYPHNTKLKVTNLSNNKAVIVRVNDTGAFTKKYGREIDLSKEAFRRIGNLNSGILKVRISPI